MKRTTCLGALPAALLACTIVLSTPTPSPAWPCFDGPHSTAQYSAKAPTCSEAQTAFRSLARPEAEKFCGSSTAVCNVSIPPCEDWATMDPANPWIVDGVMTFYCR